MVGAAYLVSHFLLAVGPINKEVQKALLSDIFNHHSLSLVVATTVVLVLIVSDSLSMGKWHNINPFP